MKVSSVDGKKLRGVAVFKHTLSQEVLSSYVRQAGSVDLVALRRDLREREIREPSSSAPFTSAEKPLTGQLLLDKLKECSGLGKEDLVSACGYSIMQEDGSKLFSYSSFYEALMEAKLESHASDDETSDSEANNSEHESRAESKVKSLHDLFNSKVYGEIDWLYSAPLLESLEIVSNALSITGKELIDNIEPSKVAIEPFDTKGNFEHGLFHLCIEIPILNEEPSLLITDTFNENRTLSSEDQDFLRISLVKNPSGKSLALDTVYSDREDAYFGSVAGSMPSLHDRPDWTIDEAEDSKIYIVYDDGSGRLIVNDLDLLAQHPGKLAYNFEHSKYLDPSEICDPPVNFSMQIGYCEGKYPEIDDFDDLDEDCLTEYMEGAGDDFTIYDSRLIINVNGNEYVIQSTEGESARCDVIRPKHGKTMVYTDSRECLYSDFPDDYGSDRSPDHGWECESLKKDILRNRIQLDSFSFVAESPRNMYWEYKGDPISAWISCDVSSEEKVEVLEDGSIIMST